MAFAEDRPYDDMDWGPRTLGPRSFGSVRERRSTIWNDDENLPAAVRDRTETTAELKGKFFPRGCRGMIEQLQIYSAGDAADTITLNISPHPCLGPLYTVNVIPLAVEGWYAADLEVMWNYDSLFIWITDVEPNASWWYDVFLPYDGHESTDAGATWEDMAIRPFIRVVYTGETPGDVPVSGTLNTIEVLSVAGRIAAAAGVVVADSVATTICTAYGAGTMLEAWLSFDDITVPAVGVLYILYLHVDGDPVEAYLINNQALTQSEVATSGRNSIGEFFQTSIYTRMRVRIPIKFRRSLRLMAYQSTGGAVNVDGVLFANMMM